MSLGEILAGLKEWSTVISGLGSLVLTTGLVVLYAKQHGLLKRDLNREVRKQHTETLRKRIRAWHGDLDEVGTSEDDYLPGETNLPTVKGASVDPSPEVIGVFGEETDFRAVPEAIEDDRYLQDLLNNHAPELKQLKEEIEGLYAEFDTKRENFISEYPGGETLVTEEYTVEPVDRFPKWVFERAVLLHRDYYETSKEREREIAETRLRGTNSGDNERAILWYSPIPPEGGPATYEVKFSSGDLNDYREYEDEYLDEIVEIHRDAIDDIDGKGVYRPAVEAAETLDRMQESVEELRKKLVEYEGHPLYTGSCPYLEEASV